MDINISQYLPKLPELDWDHWLAVGNRYLDDFLAWPHTPGLIISISAGVILAGAGYTVAKLLAGHRKQGQQVRIDRGVRMRAIEQLRIEDALTDAIEEMVFKDTIGRKRAQNMYLFFYQKTGLTGFLIKSRAHKKLHPHRVAELKAEFKVHKVIGPKKPIPGPTPPQDIINPIKLERPPKTLKSQGNAKLNAIFAR